MTLREKTKKNIIEAIENALNQAIDKQALGLEKEELPEIELEVPREKEHGDFSCTVAMRLAKKAHKAPRDIAQEIIKRLNPEELSLDNIEIAGPGFINFKLKTDWINPVITEILEEKTDYGRSQIGEGKKVNIEFVSANPTGPMHIGNARGGAIGDVLANIFDFTGHDVTREFYINDAGNQIKKFSDSLELRFRELMGEEIDFPDDLYQGKDIIERVREYVNTLSPEELDSFRALSEEERKEALTPFALNQNINQMKTDLSQYGIDYDVWFSEQTLHDSNQVQDVLEALKESGKTYEKDGAIWFKSTDYGLDKDDVLVRQNGFPTYFLVDIAYHFNKFNKRNFIRGIDVWGADHYGHVARLKAALSALGINDTLEILLMQLVQLKRNEELVRVSKRKGNTVSLSDLINQIGKDAARFFFNLRSPGSQFELDLALAVEESNNNPVFYVQYAHARISSILRKIEQDYKKELVNPNLLIEKEELELINKLSEFPEEVLTAQKTLDPSRLTHYAVDLASLFHSFYAACRVNVDNPELKASRIALVKATKQVLQNCSYLLGIETPERM